MSNVSSSNSQEANVPKLRFPEFEGEYRITTLGEIADKIVRTDPNSDAPIMMISAASGFINQSKKYSRENAGQSLKKYTLLKKGELAYNHGASKLRQFGCCFELKEKAARIPYVYHTFSINEKEYAPYIALLLNNPIMDRQLKRLVSSSVRMDGLLNISYDEYMSIKLRIPMLKAEQEKLYAFIEKLDQRIERQRQFVDALKSYKRGALSRLFPKNDASVPEYRFSGFTGDWEQRKLGELFEERNEQYPMSDEYPLMAFIANIGVAPKGERYDRSALINDEKGKKYKRTELGDFIYSSNNLEAGSIGLNNYGNACISPVYSIFKSRKNTDSDFLGRILLRKSFINDMIQYRQGVVYGQWKIHESDFLNLKIAIPSLDEQRIIGEYFKGIDQLITLHQRKLDEYKSIKQGLLEKLFI